MAGFEKNSLYYEVIDAKKKYVSVRYADWNKKPSGALSIPSEVENDGKKYVVTQIGGKGKYEHTEYEKIEDKRKKEGYRLEPNKVIEYWTGFGKCKELSSVKIPESIIEISDSAFANCSNLVKVELPSKLVKIGVFAFAYTRLTSIKLPDTVEQIGRRAFECCSFLKDVNIPKGIEVIESGTFGYCHKLKKITIPANVNIIKKDAFFYYKDYGLKEAIIDNSDDNLMIESGAFAKETKLTYKGKGLFSKLFGK